MIILSIPGRTILRPGLASLTNLPSLSTRPNSKGLIILKILNKTTPRRAIIITHLTNPKITSIKLS